MIYLVAGLVGAAWGGVVMLARIAESLEGIVNIMRRQSKKGQSE